MQHEPMYVKMARLKANTAPDTTLIEETDGRLVRLYSEKHHGACVTAPTEAEALGKMRAEINSLWSWGKGAAIDGDYTFRIKERYTVDYPLTGIRSRIIFGIEQGICNAIAYRVMKGMAVRSALALGQLLDSIPDDAAPLTGYNDVMDGLRTASEVRRITYFSTGAFIRKLGIAYDNTGDIYANRMFAIAAAETDGYMRNLPHQSTGEIWTLRKVLRRYIWQDRTLARALYGAAKQVWGDGIANPFAFGD